MKCSKRVAEIVDLDAFYGGITNFRGMLLVLSLKSRCS